jgi:hypothetical protein
LWQGVRVADRGHLKTEGKQTLISHNARPAGLEALAVFFGALAVTAMALLALTAGPARAADQPFKLDFDRSSIEMSLLGAVPLEELSGPSSIEGTIDENGNVKIPKGKFLMPVIDASAIGQSLAGIDLPVEISGYMGIEQAATGSYDRTTGQMEIQTRAGLWISINVQQLLGALGGLGVSLPPELGAITGLLGDNLTCGFSPMDVTFTTESTSLGTGERFTRGLQGPGALAGEWSQLGPFAGKTRVFGLIDACSLIRTQLPSLLSGLGGGAGIDLGGLDIASLLSGLDELDLGPSGLTITRTLDESATPAALALEVGPRRRTLRSGRAAPFRVVVANRGGSAARGVKVCALAPKRRVRGVACRALGSIAPGQAKPARFRLGLRPGKRNRSARVRFAVRSSAGSTGGSVWISKSGR